MIKKIPVSQLALGMHVHDLDCGWLDHPFALNHFTIDDEAVLVRLRDSGIAEVLNTSGPSFPITWSFCAEAENASTKVAKTRTKM